MRTEKELIKDYLKSIKFSTNEGYINLIYGFSTFKEAYNKDLIKVAQETKGSKK